MDISMTRKFYTRRGEFGFCLNRQTQIKKLLRSDLVPWLNIDSFCRKRFYISNLYSDKKNEVHNNFYFLANISKIIGN